ncbi:unnamed protein product [Bemisia tabaci]|uniref:Uncharacterized protein n=1 Tax=Bemisia tabaci TaxID=7038 RepID=A0A9P0A744_BEMTA|nr:unnamed protein product [Bemisia tabaci]
MSVTSKTGLLLSAKTPTCKRVKEPKPIEFKNIATPAPFMLRPFAGLYNPFPYGCSVLCNHPADFEAKGIVKRAKLAWAQELKAGGLESRRLERLESEGALRALGALGALDSGELGAVPDELFRRYTDTDSRAATPAPTTTSMLTSSAGGDAHGGRRCVTPDPSLDPAAPQERTCLVLDLRRSQSHETLTWPQEKFEQSEKAMRSQTRSQTPSSLSSKSRVSSKKSKKSAPTKETPEKAPPQKAAPVPDVIKAHIKMENDKLNSQLQLPSTPTNKDQGGASDKEEEESLVRRRGKPRKKRNKHSQGDMSSELNQEFKGLAEPGETQISAFVSDSRVGSARHSVNTVSAVAPEEGDTLAPAPSREPPEDSIGEPPVSFIQPEILKHLQREIDIQVVDNEFNIRRQKALAEALRMNAAKTDQAPGIEVRAVKNEIESNVNSAQNLLNLPRTFSRQSARFELPLDTSTLARMTPLEYINQHVIVTRDRRLFYNLVFECNEQNVEMTRKDALHLTKRYMDTQRIKPALSQMMGRQLSEEDLSDFERLVGWQDVQSIDFRTWSGISALCERLLGPKYCTKYPSKEEDRCHDIEKADFDTLDRKLKLFKIGPRLVEILTKIKDSG